MTADNRVMATQTSRRVKIHCICSLLTSYDGIVIHYKKLIL